VNLQSALFLAQLKDPPVFNARSVDESPTTDTLGSLGLVYGTSDRLATLDSMPSLMASLDELPELEEEDVQDCRREPCLIEDKIRWGIDAVRALGYVPDQATSTVMDAANSKEQKGICWRTKGAFLGSPPKDTLCCIRKAKREKDGKQVLVKSLSGRGIMKKKDRKSLEDEFHVLRSLQHASIITVDTLLLTRFDAWLIMESCGDCLQAAVERTGGLTEKRTYSVFVQLLKGIQHMHGLGIAHRDIRPANLLLDADQTVIKIANFQLARHELATCLQDASESLVMWPEISYVAPEFILRQKWDRRVDIWAAGLCLFFEVQAALPFDVRLPKAQAMLSAGQLPCEIHLPQASPCTRGLIEVCLAVELEARPSSRQLLDTFRRSATGT